MSQENKTVVLELIDKLEIDPQARPSLFKTIQKFCQDHPVGVRLQSTPHESACLACEG